VLTYFEDNQCTQSHTCCYSWYTAMAFKGPIPHSFRSTPYSWQVCPVEAKTFYHPFNG
jgi:hypothetical protein